MSLILDALRKADSERERGSVPGLHAQPVPPLSVEVPDRRTARSWPWLAGGVALGLVALLAWYFVGRSEPPPQRDTASAAPGQSAAPASAAAAATSVGRTGTTTAAAAAAPVATAAPPASMAEPPPIAEPAPWPSQESRRAPEKSAAPAAAARADAKAAPPASAAPADPPVVTREQLPEHIRAELPQLTIGGSIYSTVAADRSLIINGRIFRENDRLTADLSLEQIKLKAAVLRYKGYRFEIGF